MAIFKNKILVKIIASICIFLTILNFGMSNKVYAEDQVWGGVLVTPITLLLAAIGDGIMDLLHKAVQYQDISIIKIEGSPNWWQNFGEKALKILAVTVVVGLLFLTFSFVIALPLGIVTIVTESKGNGIVTFLIERLSNSWFDNDLYMPAFTLSPEEIFSNKILLFDVNFFNSKESETRDVIEDIEYKAIEKLTVYKGNLEDDIDYSDGIQNMEILIDEPEREVIENDYELSIIAERICGEYIREYSSIDEFLEMINSNIDEDMIEDQTQEKLQNIFDTIYNSLSDSDKLLYQKAALTTKKQYDNSYTGVGRRQVMSTIEIGLTEYENGEFNDKIVILMELDSMKPIPIMETMTIDSTAKQLSGVISSWYYILRNLAIAALLLILIYVGIRIVMGSTAGEKAKYKERLTDCCVAICLIFIMHYIMIFAITLEEKLVDLIASIDDSKEIIESIELSDNQLKSYKETADGEMTLSETNTAQALNSFGYLEKGEVDGKEISILNWRTNLMGKMRIKSQTINEGTAKWLGYTFCYIILVLYTLFFSWTYLKRVLYLAFLTIVAPLVAMTYPIDKINDGKAQAFNMWLKEYIFNLLIQPLHLLLYVMLINMAFTLAANNPLYAIVAIGFLVPSEKLVRRFFGFTKAQTPGLLGGAAGAALAMAGLQKLMRMGQKNKGDSNDSKGGSKDESSKVKFSKKDGVNAMDAIAGSSDDKTTGKGIGGQPPKTTNGSNDNNTNNQTSPITPISTSTPTSGINNPLKDLKFTSNLNKNYSASSNMNKVATKPIKNSRIKAYGRAIKGASKAYARGLGKKALKRIKKGKPIRSLARGVTGVVGATAFGMTGLAVGVASGDASKAFQYTTAGIAGGYGAGKGLAGKATDAFTVDGEKLKDETKMAYYGDDYKKVQQEKEKEKWMKDEDNINYMRKMTGRSREDVQDILSNVGSTCYDSGITDAADIAAINRMQEEGMSIEKAIAAKKYNDRLQADVKNMTSKDKEEYIKTWDKEFENAGYTQNSRKYAEEAMQAAEQFNKALSDIKKF